MWLFSKHGFVSIVEHDQNPEALIIRARVREDLEWIVVQLNKILPARKHRIQRTEERDYLFRTVAYKTTFARLLFQMVVDIDYTNFKARVHGDPERDQAYMAVWSSMVRFQIRKNRIPSQEIPDFFPGIKSLRLPKNRRVGRKNSQWEG